jgi:hypothetical protein
VRVARLADNQILASGMAALAAALPQMPSLTSLHLSSKATRARSGFLFGARASVVTLGSSGRVLRRAGAQSNVGGGR